jgi:proteasome lid subunit RPN8/RPN11
MAITVTSAVVQALLGNARDARPQECCGLLFGTADAVTAHRPAANVHPQPSRHFEIDPQALIDAHRNMRQGGPRLIGYYHSHPTGNCEPSATDRALAAGDGMIWAIIAEGRLALWRANESGLSALSYTQV